MMNRGYALALAMGAVIALAGCELVGIDDEDAKGPQLIVTARSGTTLTLQWDAMPAATQGYTVDYFAMPTCSGLGTHNDVLHVSGVEVKLTGLAPATAYNIHVHSLPHGGDGTNNILVHTLAEGAAEVAVTPSDYEPCNG